MKSLLVATVALSIGGMVGAASGNAAEAGFTFKAAHRNVTADPDGVWTGSALAGGNVSIYEYELRTTQGVLLVSQIWNEDCAASTCPTRLVRLGPGGRSILVDDMMRQVIPPNDPRFAGVPKNGAQAVYAEHPFRLSADGKTLLNGDFKFEIGEDKP